jgi:hypothetical protein
MMNNEILAEATKRMPSQRERILEVLRKAGRNGVLNTDLVKLCIRYTGRLAELYQMGYKIDVDNVEKGVCIYTLREEPKTLVTDIPTAISVLAKTITEDYHGAITPDTLTKLLKSMNFNVVRKAGSHKAS